MTENNNSPSIKNTYEQIHAKVKQNKRISPFWLLPFVAFCIGAILFFQIIQEQGINIKITFINGDGIIANKTPIRYQGLQIGVVKKVNFTEDLKQVEVLASIDPEAKTVLRQHTKFWVVRPSASLAGISGIDALVSGNYITLQPSDGDFEDEFIAETEGPIAQLNDGDLLVHLLSDDLGSISIGASVYFKKIPVGKIYDYRLVENNKVEIDIVIDKTYAGYVKQDSHFWNISGVNADINLSGIRIDMSSLNAIVQGAVAFDSPIDSQPAKNNQKFTLYSNLHAAKRGVQINVRIPNVAGLQTGKTEVYSDDTAIGVLSELSAVENNEDLLQGKLLIDPNLGYLFKDRSQIVLRNKKLSLGDITNVKKVLRGDYFQVLPGGGERKTDFTVIKESEWLIKQPNTLLLTLNAPETFGVGEGEPIYYNHIQIGQIIRQNVNVEGVKFQVGIAEQYRHLIHKNTLFIAASNFEVNLGLDGLKIEAAHPETWLQSGIRIINNGKSQGKALESYPLYSSLSNAENGITNEEINADITLTSTHLPNINKGSIVLYRQYEVGKILDVRPETDHFEVDIFLYPKYKKLLTDKSIFWVESAAQVDITPKGISIQASPIGRSLKGAISFDNTGSSKQKTLYANELRAKSAGQVINLTANDASNLSKGMTLRYMGLTVGEVDQVRLNNNKNGIIATALIHPNYMSLVAKEGSQFKVISPQISAGGIKNLDSLLQPYIDVEAGKGKYKTQFSLQQSASTPIKYGDGLPIILETSDANNISIGSPILYRGVEVGTVREIKLNSLGDRVLVHITIANKYQHLVRQNSEFWIASGYGMDIGFSGVSINTGSMQQLLKGGISFSTPSGTVVQPQAKANRRFLLQIKQPPKASHWNSGAMAE